MSDSNVIIAGANKSGTTSLFRYLSAHPDICPSSVKETDFFLEQMTGSASSQLENYYRFFSACSDNTRVKLEASPGYLTGGKDIAMRIHAVLPRARLIFCLRDPVSRLLSYYFRNRQTQFHPGLAALELDGFIDLLERVVQDPDNVPAEGAARNALLQFDRGLYRPHLSNFREYFAAKQISIVMFDDLVKDTLETVVKICGFIGIDDAFYEDYRFSVENKTRNYRIPFLQKAGARWGKDLEHILNRAPGLRSALRKILLTRETAQKKPHVDAAIIQRIKALYAPCNRELAEYLSTEFPGLALPEWLESNDSTARNHGPAANPLRESGPEGQ